MVIKEAFKNSVFLDTYRHLRKNPKTLFKMLLFDVLFVASIMLANLFFNLVFPKNPETFVSLVQTSKIFLFVLIFLLLVYFLILLFIYSVFKYLNLDLLQSLEKKTKLDLKEIWKFFKLNIFDAIFVSLSFILLSIILLSIFKQQFLTFVGILFGIPFVFIMGYLPQISHIVFTKEKAAWKNFKESFSLLFNNIPSLILVLVFVVVCVLIFGAFYYLVTFIVGVTLLNDYASFVAYGEIYKGIFVFLLAVALYAILSFARAYLYFIIRRKIHHKQV